MSDEQENVETNGGDATGEQPASEPAPEAVADPSLGAYEPDDEPETPADEVVPSSADESRTGYVTGARSGDECICPDGRKGTVYSFDTGLVCIPNADQG